MENDAHATRDQFARDVSRQSRCIKRVPSCLSVPNSQPKYTWLFWSRPHWIIANSHQIPLFSYLQIEAAAVFACPTPWYKHNSDFLTFFGEFLLGAHVYLWSQSENTEGMTNFWALGEISWGELALPGWRPSKRWGGEPHPQGIKSGPTSRKGSGFPSQGSPNYPLPFFGYFILLWLPGSSEVNQILFQALEEFFLPIL